MRLVLLPIVLCAVCVLQAKPLAVNVSASAAIVINAETGAVLYEKNSDRRCFPASVTKIVTALYALEKCGGDVERLITAEREALMVVPPDVRQASGSQHPSYRLESDGLMLGIRAGEQISLKSLLYGLMLGSCNDAANVIAMHVGGSVPQFMQEVNAYLKEHGILHTAFNNPHGFYHPEHYTTPADMAAIARLALEKSLFREIVKTLHYTCPPSNKRPAVPVKQINRFVKPGPFFYLKAIGVKTGYVAKAKYTLVAAAEHEGRRLIAVLFEEPQAATRYRDAKALFEAAFAEKKIERTLFTKEHDVFSVSIKGLKERLEAKLAEDLRVSYYPAEEPSFKAFLQWNRLQLPLAAGSVVGEVRLITPEGKVIKTAPMYASKALEAPSQVGRKILYVALLIAIGGAVVAFYCSRLKRAIKPSSESS